jgi:enoyl-CoA hydratase/carnithine racemase
MSLMSIRREGTVAILSLDAGENRHHPAFVAELLAALDTIEADEAASSCVLASSDAKNWSQGIDLPWIISCMPDPARHDDVRGFLRGLNRIYARLLTYPMPMIAAINGHCFGNGAILACACDFRVARADRGFFCFPEVDVNIPFLPGMLAVVKKAVPEPALTRWILEGRRVPGDELVAAGVAMKAVEGGEAVLAEAVAYGATFTKGRKIVGKLKSRMHKDVLATFDRDDPAIIDALALIA